ncbi:protein PIN-LIKES 3-like isoform X1 [Magnolia sinica]|uniref:protein PIN-LIKES 3-like isoform X1 n=1 Tax=Magnolia sinica TaxID=86752 RepID=UPI002659641E|nr:protein PIN-LIKES 3-like isoform X1 [Magnolia sinica]XP_058069883.1 protein PIN-LIKES 3-like isoform X1 [Magnolia sinica]
MGLRNLFISAAMPVLKLLIVTGVGSYLATKRVGILGGDARKHLNNVVFYVFNPCFVYINLSKTITLKSMVSLWFMPLNILLTFIIGTVLGWVVIQIIKPPSRLRGLVLGCCAGGNLGNMLIIIVPAICKEKGNPFGAQDLCNKYGLAYASLSMAIGSIFLWSYVYNVVRISSSWSDKSGIVNGVMASTNLPEERSKARPGEPISTQNPTMCEHLEDQREPPSTRTEELNGKPMVPVPVPAQLKQILKTISGKVNLKKLLAPSTIGVIIGFFIGMIAPIRKLLIGENAPLRVIQASAALLGDGAIPTTTIIMGGNLTKGIRKSEVRVSLIIAIIIVRYIALPLLGVGVVEGAIHLGLVHKDPLYQFILLLQFALPPAMDIGTMTQLFGAGESECSVILLWTYSLAILSLTLWSAFFMWLVS